MATDDIVEAWKAIPGMVSDAVAGLDDTALEERTAAGDLTIRESVQHIAEANLVAAGIVVAGRGAPGCVFDWSWMMPFGEWVTRMGYGAMPIETGLALIRAVNAFIAFVVSREGAIDSPLALRDTTGGDPRSVTVRDVLKQEFDHARDHVARIAAARARPGS